MEEHFQKIAAQMADIEATKPRAQLLDHAQLPQRERGAPKVAEQFWRQAATRKDRAPLKRRPHTLGRSKRKSLPSLLTRWVATPAPSPVIESLVELAKSCGKVDCLWKGLVYPSPLTEYQSVGTPTCIVTSLVWLNAHFPCSAGSVRFMLWFASKMPCQGWQCTCRKRIKKATATADGEAIEDAANDLEDSDAEDEGDASFIQSDEEELSGTFLNSVFLVALANVTLTAETVLQPLALAFPQMTRSCN